MITDHTVPLSGTPLLTAVNGIGHKHCMSETGNYARSTIELHVCACNTAEARASQLPVTFYGMLELVARIECDQVDYLVHLDRITLTLPTHPRL